LENIEKSIFHFEIKVKYLHFAFYGNAVRLAYFPMGRQTGFGFAAKRSLAAWMGFLNPLSNVEAQVGNAFVQVIALGQARKKFACQIIISPGIF
jgi:hypothetical protein